MTFAAPLFLLAALAGLVPVLVHLIHRQKAREIRFSTLRFLRISVQKTRRRKYVEDVSLLTVRVAVLLLLALGLARPAISSLAGLWGRGQTRAIAIVLDNSASMAVTDNGKPRFETAREGAEQVLARLRQGDQVALLPTGGAYGPELGQLFRTHETVRQALDQCRPSFERADLAAKLQQARDLLAAAQTPNKEIYVFSDNQKLSWEGLKDPAENADADKTKRPGEAPVILVNVDREPVPNVALQTVTVNCPAPVAGAPFQATVEVLNTAIIPQQKHLELQIDGAREAVSPILSLAAGGTAKYDFRFTLDREGVHRGEVKLVEDDGSPLDNHLYFAVTVDQQIPLAIVKARRDEVPQADDSFYLERALAPGGSVGGAFRITTLTAEMLAASDISGQTVVFCVNLPALPPQATEKVLGYARSGGHIVWVCGQNVEPLAYNAMNALGQGQLLPAPLEELRQPLPGGVDSWHLGFLDKDSLALAPLTEPASLYQSVLIYKHFPMTWGSQTAARALIKLNDGLPLLAERQVGAGSVLLLGTSLHVDWTNLPLKPLFLPLVARLTFQLAGVEGERTMALAGAPVIVPLGKHRAETGAGKPEVEVVRPSGEAVRPSKLDLVEGGFRYADTHDAGIYLVRLINRKPAQQMAFAVNIDPAESDPATLTKEDLQARFGTRPLFVCDGPGELSETISRLREGISLWEWFLAAVLICLVLEVFLANRRAQAPATGTSSAAGTSPAGTRPEETVTIGEQTVTVGTAESATPPVADDVHGFLESLQQEAARPKLRG
ncbi:MAG: vWA domain-containing protein [Isosphaeraceae bacterium]